MPIPYTLLTFEQTLNSFLSHLLIKALYIKRAVLLVVLITSYSVTFLSGQYQYAIHIDAAQSFDVSDYFDKISTKDDAVHTFSFIDSKDSISIVSNIRSSLSKIWQDGYLTARLDTVVQMNEVQQFYVYVGEKFEFSDVKIDKKDIPFISAAGLKNVNWKEKAVSKKSISSFSEELIIYLENNGYPFASISMDSVTIDNGKISASVDVAKGKYVPFDSLQIIGDINLRKSFLPNYLEIKANESYSKQKIDNIRSRINDLPYLSQDSTSIINFVNDKAKVSLFLQEKKASRFDFIIGVQPNNESGVRQFSVTGDFTAEMHNRLGHGEYIFANIQTRPGNRVLNLDFKYPYLFDQPIGIEASGSIFFNSEFRETVASAGLLYQFSGVSSLGVVWENKTSRLIEIDTASIVATRRLPSRLDIAYNGGGLTYTNRTLDYIVNPSKGWTVSIGSTVGIKRLIRNNTIEELSRPGLDFNAAYDSLKVNTLQAELKLNAAGYIPLFSRGVLKLGLDGGMIFNEQQVFENEFYRIGGNKLLRGFDELTVLTDRYLVSTAEFRLLLDRNSFLSLPFIDYGLTRLRINDEDVWDNAISVGFGINFATQAGIFNVSLASGSRLNNPFDLGNTKIHFGYVSLF